MSGSKPRHKLAAGRACIGHSGQGQRQHDEVGRITKREAEMSRSGWRGRRPVMETEPSRIRTGPRKALWITAALKLVAAGLSPTAAARQTALASA